MTGMISRLFSTREIDVRQSLCFDALRGVDQQQRALAGGQRASDLVAEVDVARGIDQVEDVLIAVSAPYSSAERDAP